MNKLKYFGLLILYIVVYIFAMVFAPVFVQFAEMRFGPTNNKNSEGVEPRLPSWLFWFDTSYDNSPCYRDWETDRKSTRLNSSHRL